MLAESNRQIFVWTERTGAEPIELAPGLHGCTQGSVTRTSWRLSSEISYGHVAGGTCINAADQLEPFVWSAQQGMVALGTLDGYELDELFAASWVRRRTDGGIEDGENPEAVRAAGIPHASLRAMHSDHGRHSDAPSQSSCPQRFATLALLAATFCAACVSGQ